jgi:flagellar FliL protein
MADPKDDSSDTEAKPRSKAWLLAPLLAIPLAAGGFWVAYSGMLSARGADPVPNHAPEEVGQGPSFIELEPLRISVGGAGSTRQLQFRAALQVARPSGDRVIELGPRILDILATYLRALPVDVLQDPTALLRIRAQMLQRIRLLAGPDVVEDLLIMDFVIA